MTIARSTTVCLAVAACLALPVAVTAAPLTGQGRTEATSIRTDGWKPELVSGHRMERLRQDSLPAQVVVGWGGRVTVVWQRPSVFEDGGYRAARLMASVRGPRGTWSKPVAVSGRYDETEQTWDVAAGSGDDVTLVWTTGTGEARTVYEAHTEGDSAWSSPSALGPGSEPRVAVDGVGNTSMIWTDKGVVLATRNAADGTWTSQRIAVPPPAFDERPFVEGAEIAVNRAGAAVAMWTHSAATPPFGHAVYRPASTSGWSAPVPLPGPLFDFEGPGLALDGAGNVLAGWVELNRVVWARRDVGTGTWSSPRRVPGDTGTIDDYGDMDVVLTNAGRGLLSWAAESGSYVARWNEDTGAGRAVRLRQGDRWFTTAGEPMLTLAGKAVVAGWTQGARARHVAFLRSRSGRAWSTVALPDTARHVPDAAAKGGRMAVVYGTGKGLFVLVRG